MTKHDLSYHERAAHTQNPTAQALFNLLDSKRTNLALAADVTKADELLQLADKLGPELCVLKTHIDILEDFTPSVITELTALAEKHQFILFEDRKFADIGNTVIKQYAGGQYHIADWANIITAHSVPGSGIITGLKEVGLPRGNGLLLLAEMSSRGALCRDDYTKDTVELGLKYPDFVIGFIAMNKLVNDPGFLHFTPGVKIIPDGDDHGQQYMTPENAILERGSDIIIVGRDIYQADNPLKRAKEYREQGWDAYLKR